MLPSTREVRGFTTSNDVNGKEYVPEFYTSDIANINSQIKFWVNEKLFLDAFIQKIKDLIECQERQYIDDISGTGNFEFVEKFKYFEIGRAWFPMIAKGTNNAIGHLDTCTNSRTKGNHSKYVRRHFIT